ncbi:slipin family protein [Gordonia sp. ABSL1-1]|uniref:slipin family protein n=1 Tax=Gordonia sp. ABSL1-1 TaxID=3053923 RepID=UPI0025724193|nr:slipin family protein [Gordonia sp. ABSL1-1]MDL9935171.1 slipin family protein [Gordonia sp. ABSL1-1]
MSMFTNPLVVDAGQVALEYREGDRQRILTAGTYRRRRAATYVTVDMRTRLVPVAPQEVPTADGIGVRVSLTIQLRVTDPVAFIEIAADPVATVYLAAQVALREVCAGVEATELTRRTSAFDADAIRVAAATAAEPVGIEVVSIAVRDVIVPQEIRSSALDLVTAKARGLAKLETARAETASLRALANAGRVLEQYPALAQLRLVQEAPYGSRILLGVDTSPTVAAD